MEAVDQQREVRLLLGIFHTGQGPVQGFTKVEGAGPVQPLLHHTVSHLSQFHGF